MSRRDGTGASATRPQSPADPARPPSTAPSGAASVGLPVFQGDGQVVWAHGFTSFRTPDGSNGCIGRHRLVHGTTAWVRGEPRLVHRMAHMGARVSIIWCTRRSGWVHGGHRPLQERASSDVPPRVPAQEMASFGAPEGPGRTGRETGRPLSDARDVPGPGEARVAYATRPVPFSARGATTTLTETPRALVGSRDEVCGV